MPKEKKTRKARVSKPDKETLQKLLQGYSVPSIAVLYATSETTVRKWMRQYGIAAINKGKRGWF